MLILSNNHKKTIFEGYSTIRNLASKVPSKKAIEAFFNQPELAFLFIFFAKKTLESERDGGFEKLDRVTV